MLKSSCNCVVSAIYIDGCIGNCYKCPGLNKNEMKVMELLAFEFIDKAPFIKLYILSLIALQYSQNPESSVLNPIAAAPRWGEY